LPTRRSVPQPTISRLALYLRDLRAASREGIPTLSSREMEKRTGISSSQIRKDLSYFGEFGKPGMGYEVAALTTRLEEIMCPVRDQGVLVAGAGNLGTALAGYAGFSQCGFRVAAVYDNDPGKIGHRRRGIEILDIQRLPAINREMKVRIGIMATPASSVQEVANLMVAGGVQVILNFAPARISVPEGVTVRNVDLTLELQTLCYYLPAAEGSSSA